MNNFRLWLFFIACVVLFCAQTVLRNVNDSCTKNSQLYSRRQT